MILYFKAYSRKNHDIEEVLANKCLRGCQVNDPIIVFGDSIRDSEIKLNKIYSEIFKFIKRDMDLRSGSFIVEVDDMIGQVIKEKYGFK